MDTLTNGMWILGSLTYLATSSYHHSLNGRVSLIAQRNEYNLNASKGFIDITQYLRTTILATLILNKASIEVSKACGFEKHIKFPILAVGALTLPLYPFSWLPNPSIYSIEDFIPNNQF